MSEGPYRTAATGESCPRCQGPMEHADGLAPRACASGCGEWAGPEVIEAL